MFIKCSIQLLEYNEYLVSISFYHNQNKALGGNISYLERFFFLLEVPESRKLKFCYTSKKGQKPTKWILTKQYTVCLIRYFCTLIAGSSILIYLELRLIHDWIVFQTQITLLGLVIGFDGLSNMVQGCFF